MSMTIRNATTAKKGRFRLRVSLTVAAAAAVLLGTARQAPAQTTTTETTTNDVTFVVTACNPSTGQLDGEAVDISAQETHRTQIVQSPSSVKISDALHDQGSGTGQTTSAQYGFSSMSQLTFQASTPTFSLRTSLREHLIRQGAAASGDDFFLLHTIIVNVTDGHVTFKDQDPQAACR